mgnify:CR=1 FL=1
MPRRNELYQQPINETMPVTWAATGVGWIATLIGFVITCSISVYGCEQSDIANRIANAAVNQNERLAAQNEAFQLRLKNLDQYFASPRLKLVRFRRVSAARYVVTVQNDGERQVAIFGASLNPSRVIGSTASTSSPFVPETNRITAIEIPFTDPRELERELPVPAIVHPGEIISIAITLANGAAEGDIYLDQSSGEPMHVGVYSMTPFPSQPASADAGLDDLFGQ